MEEGVGVGVGEGGKEQHRKQDGTKDKLLYGVEDVPPWYQCLLLGFQNFLIFVGGTIATPMALVGYMCLDETDPGRGEIVATLIFVSGIITLMQSTLGVRLPIIQGGNFAYLAPTITLLTTSFPPCDTLNLHTLTKEERTEVWQDRVRSIQGAVTVSSLLQVFIGFTGLEGLLLMMVTPLTIVATVAMLGLSLASVSCKQAASYWPVAVVHLLLLVLVSQYLKKVKTPLPFYSRGRGCYVRWLSLFTYFPLLLVTLLTWAGCWVLTAADALPKDSAARTDRSGSLLSESPWFRIPYPGQWGAMTVSVSGVVGMLASVIASIIESIGDYNACADICQVVSPPLHAVTRGSGVEGLGSVLAGVFGTTSGTASYTGNITLIGMTKVASRRVVQWSGVIMLVLGVFCKFCAVFATIPEPVLGANLMFMFSLITGIAFSTLRLIDLTSMRNLFVLGFSIFMGLALPDWASRNPHAINTGISSLDNTITALVQTAMFVGGFFALVLDNAIPGTAEERGLTNWLYYQQGLHPSPHAATHPTAHTYDLPCGMDAIRRWKWTRLVPFLPTFEGFRSRRGGGITPEPSHPVSHPPHHHTSATPAPSTSTSTTTLHL